MTVDSLNCSPTESICVLATVILSMNTSIPSITLRTFPSFRQNTSMILLLYIPMTNECLGYSTPDVCHWYQTAARLRIAVLNSLQPQLQAVLHSLYRNTSVQVSATLTQWLTSVMIAPLVCALRINSLRCLVRSLQCHVARQAAPTASERFLGSSPSSRTWSSLLQETSVGTRSQRRKTVWHNR